MKRTQVSLACGTGGGTLGLIRAGFESAAAIDNDEAACRSFEIVTGRKATLGDLATMSPQDLRRICPESPDVAFTSAPCKGFSGCLPEAKSRTPHYVALNSLALRSVWLALEAWGDRPPRLLLFENVPLIQTRGSEFLRQITALLHAYGYAVAITVHDCGELGGLAQHRKRLLLVARHMESVPAFLRVPYSKRVRGVGEVLGELPVPLPGSPEGGPMHRLPKLSALNWVRLALIPAGKDWRAIPQSVRLPDRAARQNGQFGVESWDDPAHAVIGHSSARDSWGSVADPRVVCRRRDGGHGVKAWDEPSSPIIAHPTIDNFPCQVADPRLGCAPHNGVMGVLDWAEPSHTVRAHHNTNNAPAAIADPRVPQLDGPGIDIESKRPIHLVIRAADGTWHRPMTTLELLALQSFPTKTVSGEWLVLAGQSHGTWRELIGNAVPPDAAEAIGRSCAVTLAAADDGRWMLDSGAIWVRDLIEEAASA